jgi:hypothetical protein
MCEHTLLQNQRFYYTKSHNSINIMLPKKMCVSNCIQQNFLNINISRSHVPQNPSLIQILLIFRRMHDDHIEMIELNGFSS